MASASQIPRMLAERAAQLSIRAGATKKKKPDWNLKLAQYFGAAIMGTIAIFMVLHWTRFLYKKLGGHRSKALAPIVSLTRRVLLRPVAVYPSVGHALMLPVFFGIHVVCLLVRLDYHDTEAWGKRFGWVCTVDILFVVVLAMKNNVVGYITGYTYERLQVLHRTVGYTIIFLMVVHTILYSVNYRTEHKLPKLIELNIVMGIIAGCSMLVLLALRFVLRTRQYELFYVTHVLLFLLAIATLGRHRPKWSKGVPQACVLAVCLWGADRLVRRARFAVNAINNSAALTAVAGDSDGGAGATRIVLKKRLRGARPGQHCYVWIPRVRALETHPFTIVANGPGGLELVANTRGGFTKALYDRAAAAGATGPQSAPLTLWASVDGPYGSFPNLHDYDRVILLAGGSGATFTFGLATHLVENLKPGSQQKLDFIWAVRKNERLAWFRAHIDTLLGYGAHVETIVHVTADTPPGLSPVDSEHSLTGSGGHTEKTANTAGGGSSDSSNGHRSDDDEKAAGRVMPPASAVAAVQHTYGLKNIRYEKLRVVDTIQSIVATIDSSQRVLIAACGPGGLITEARAATAACIRPDGPSIELHYESFDW